MATSWIRSIKEVVDHSIEETVINVNERMTYTSVKKILEEKDEEESYKDCFVRAISFYCFLFMMLAERQIVQ